MRYAGVLLWVAIIFFLSTGYFSSARTAPLITAFVFNALPDLSSVNPVIIVRLVRKLAHWTEYFVFAVVLMRALSSTSAKRLTKPQIIWALILGVICAVVDETHQLFVLSRSASIRDVLIDATGFLCGILTFHACVGIRKGLKSCMQIAPASLR
jgi:VanZ family protein